MSQYLPTDGFKWFTEKEINNMDLAKYKEDSKTGVILEVDLEYPQELHDLHSDCPLAPEKDESNKRDVISPCCESIKEKSKISIGQVHKLIPTLKKKEEYVLHYRNLQLYTNLGLKVKNIHRVLEFNQSPWLKQYINLNTQKKNSS